MFETVKNFEVFCPYFVLSLAEDLLGRVVFCVEHFKGAEQ